MSESAGGFTEFDSSEKKTDKVKLISIVINVVFLIIIIGLAVGIGVKARSKSVTVIPANPVSSEQLVPITGQYYSDAIRGAAEIQGKGDILDSKYFTMNDYYNMESSGSLHILPKFRTYQQTSDYTCGCACVLMAMDFVGKHDNSLTEAKCAELADIGTDIHQSAAGNDGAYPANLIKVLQMYNYEVESNNGTATYSFEDYATFRDWAINSIDNGWPIIVLSNDLAGSVAGIIGVHPDVEGIVGGVIHAARGRTTLGRNNGLGANQHEFAGADIPTQRTAGLAVVGEDLDRIVLGSYR